jgi:lysophosphatidylcholine acyltransferase/lyso-PAF acetyltransferase
MNRQNDYLEGRIHTPLMVFPEGTVTSGKHLLPFKKGAFLSQAAIKPYLVKIPEERFSISYGAFHLYQHVFLIMCFLYHNLTFYELPVIRPTKHMFDKYGDDKREKWEVFAEVVRSIYKEVGGFELSQKTYKDSLDYTSYIMGTLITNT